MIWCSFLSFLFLLLQLSAAHLFVHLVIFDDMVWEDIMGQVHCINVFIFVEGPKCCNNAHFVLVLDNWFVVGMLREFDNKWSGRIVV